MKIYATNLTNKPSPQKPMYSNEWRISETSLVPVVNASCGVKTKHSRLKPVYTHEEFVT
jgi:hypothetical protein